MFNLKIFLLRHVYKAICYIFSSLNLSNSVVHLVCQNQLVSVPRSCAAEHIRRFKIRLGRNSACACLVIGVERPLKIL